VYVNSDACGVNVKTLAPPTKASIKAAPWGEGERPCASFGSSTGKGESTAFPIHPQFMAGTVRSNTQHVWNLVTGSASLPQLYQEATYLQNVSFTPEANCNFIYVHLRSVVSQAVIFTGFVTALRRCVVFFCMGFQPNRSTSMVSRGRNIVMPLCKVRADFPNNSHLLQQMSP